ncbi:hypothetical protein EKO27_g10008 [Xylaria grammica]|uniref:Serine protease n=1 Tax=Xylaria grammica TaxID=363999 RepID=A0A439CSD4_9PEZI|nr:hypothetical protein EKO27_g10008 [Xylaria grammica]
MRILAWNLVTTTSPIQLEGIINRSPRNVVEHQLIKQGNKYSGIFKIVSLFEGPNGTTYEIQGTAFAVTRSHVLTSAHNMWDRKLGPAKRAALFLDEREDKHAQYIKTCVAVASHAKWVDVQHTENDFCMVAIAKPFDPEVCILQCHPGPRPSGVEKGTVVGFPFDLPETAPGKHLILSEGTVACHVSLAGVMIEHEVDTVGGNSGSPVVVDGQVVGVHSAFMHHENKNRAAPVNQNGNNVDELISVLSYMGDSDAGLPVEITYISEARGVRVFGEDMPTHENGKGFGWRRGWEEWFNQTLVDNTNIHGY